MIVAIAVMGLLTGVVREWCCFDLRKVPDLGFLGNLLNQLIVIFFLILGGVVLLDEVRSIHASLSDVNFKPEKGGLGVLHYLLSRFKVIAADADLLIDGACELI